MKFHVIEKKGKLENKRYWVEKHGTINFEIIACSILQRGKFLIYPSEFSSK